MAFQADGETFAKTWAERRHRAFLELALKFDTAKMWRGAVICGPEMGKRRNCGEG